MIFTQAGHISKGLTVSWVGNRSAPTLVSRVTHTAGECWRRAFVLGPPSQRPAFLGISH